MEINGQRHDVREYVCSLFLLCDRDAVVWHDAGPLGPVPGCQRCHDKLESFR